MLPRKSLTQTLADQSWLICPYTVKLLIARPGLIRYGMVLSITLASGITNKALRVSPLLAYTLSLNFTCGQ
ncbi:hypothetical protein JB92DRAFT_1389429 [Gautieria morchelliformis]|nr:hypothetical protein JB92DRAFT_1389429 [Gautieria morchelliformis]